MTEHTSELAATVTPAQEASLAKANDIIGCGTPKATAGRGGSTQFIYTDPSGEESALRLILDSDGSFIDLLMWVNEDETYEVAEGSYDSDWASIDGGGIGEDIQAALRA